MAGLVGLLSDFGTRDYYVGSIKGAVLAVNPGVMLVDITHEVEPQDVDRGSFILACAYRQFPAGTVFLAVVDPGVGAERRPIAAAIAGYLFVCPDNGLLTDVLLSHPLEKAVHLDRPQYWRPQVSPTFHGRDIFAPVAGHLSLGVPLDELGSPLLEVERLEIAPPSYAPDAARGTVRHVDRFGNLITTIRGDDLLRWAQAPGERLLVSVRDITVEGVRTTYQDVVVGELVALVGSTGFLEISVNRASAAALTLARPGTEVTVGRAQTS